MELNGLLQSELLFQLNFRNIIFVNVCKYFYSIKFYRNFIVNRFNKYENHNTARICLVIIYGSTTTLVPVLLKR